MGTWKISTKVRIEEAVLRIDMGLGGMARKGDESSFRADFCNKLNKVIKGSYQPAEAEEKPSEKALDAASEVVYQYF